MPKLLLSLLTLILLCTSPTHAQTRRFAIRAGANYSLMNFNKGMPTPPTTVPNSWKPGFGFSFQMRVPLVKSLSLNPEYGYAKLNGEDKRNNAEYNFDYLTLPVLVKLECTNWFTPLAGPQFDLLLHAKRKLNGISSNTTHDTEERNISGVIGAEFKILDPLSIDLRYAHGLNHIGLGQRSSTTEFKWQSLQLAVKYAF